MWALGQGVAPPSRLHEPAHRPSGLVATPPALQDFADTSTTGGFVRSSREEDTSQKLASSSTVLCGMSDMPLLRQGVAALNATPPGQWHITQVPRWLPSLAEGCKHIVFFAGTPAAKEGRSFISEIDLQSGPTQLGFDFLVLGKLGRRHFLTLGSGMGFSPFVHPASSRFVGPDRRILSPS